MFDSLLRVFVCTVPGDIGIFFNYSMFLETKVVEGGFKHIKDMIIYRENLVFYNV
jgi:hypothetical protein